MPFRECLLTNKSLIEQEDCTALPKAIQACPLLKTPKLESNDSMLLLEFASPYQASIGRTDIDYVEGVIL